MTDVELSNLILDRSFHFVDAGDLTMSNGCSPEIFSNDKKFQILGVDYYSLLLAVPAFQHFGCLKRLICKSFKYSDAFRGNVERIFALGEQILRFGRK